MKGLAAFIRPLRWKLLVSVLIGLVRIAASLGFVWICKHLVDIATGVVDAPFGPSVAIMAGIMVLQLLSNVSSSYWEGYLTVTAKNSERFRHFGYILHSRWQGRESFHSGDIINRIEGDVDIVVNLVCERIPEVAITLCQLVAASIFLITLAPNLAWLLILLMTVAVIGSRLFFGKMRRLTTAIRAREGQIQGYMQENIANRVVVMTLIGTEKVMTRLGWMQRDVRDNTVIRLNYGAIGRSFMTLGFLAGYAAAFLYGVFGIRDKSITYGTMTAFLQLVGQVQRPIADVARHIPAFIHSLTSIERLMDLEEMPEEPHGEPILLPGAPQVTFSHVDYTYPGGLHPVLKDFSYTFEGGKMTVVEGETGAGKSTLIRLAMALMEPSAGEITIDGVKASADTRANFMYVPQGNSLMSGTIRDNLLLAREDATDEELRHVLEIAAADFVFQLPEGLDTPCSEKGGGLSEGQAQRIAIARGLLRSGGILILDEATSAVDPETERRILEGLEREMHGHKTIIFISHRESVARITDNILSM